ncbi:alpha-L-fucosidase [Lactobacillus sp. ESL0684]|uniref:alpha-L-fucosidase n=1 Tax=Lactobacillus sp. ESL0684 TaxID=2983213 RepID=UPI0023FA21A2|nr:alpha-L-fucosidase [Lactobacillus sp. ESL0684]WEV43260.1 alpha-L-fucosidase [Lactobacillus sp. ESL0684]
MTEIPTRIKNYENMGIGLFIHWGLYSQLAKGEWTEYIHQHDQVEYEKLINSFAADNFDADKIVLAAKQMGAKYIVLTTKHHEGFFLYDTKCLSTFDAIHSLAHRDLIKEFVNACNKYDIKPFFYMATYDWHSPLYQNNFNDYLDYLLNSVKILCQNYGPIGGFWFDGDWDKKDANWKHSRLYGMIRKYQPEAIIINNTGLKERGQISNSEIDVVTYERETPSQVNHGFDDKYVAGEASITMNKHWGFAKNDLDFKSGKELIENIVHCRGIGANILLNIGLTGSGKIPEINHAIMQQIGNWTEMASEAIYKTRPEAGVQANGNQKDLVLGNDKNKYLFIHDLEIVGNDNVVLGGEGNTLRSFEGFFKEIKAISWLDNGEKLSFMQEPKNGTLTINASGYVYGSDWCVRIAKVTFK